MACRWFLFYEDKLLLEKEANGYAIPAGEKPPFETEEPFAVALDGVPSAQAASLKQDIDEGERFVPREWYKRAGKAYQLVHWDRHSRFCPRCGAKLIRSSLICKQCEACHEEYYPVISPAIIVLIRKGDEVLLVHARNFKGNFRGLVAGFLEVGETLEECVRREVREETGLSIQNLTYFGSQPWPYPSGIMIGFFADYAGGAIHLQDEELNAGSFFTRDNLPVLPQKLSIARRMIDYWLAGEKGEKPAF